MGRERLEDARAAYQRKFGKKPAGRGAKANWIDAEWLEGQAFGPPGEQGVRGKTGRKGSKGDQGDQGDQGLQGKQGPPGLSSFLPITLTDPAQEYFDNNQKPDGLRLKNKFEVCLPDVKSKLSEAIAMLLEGTPLHYQLCGIGSKIILAQAAFETAKNEAQCAHDAVKAAAVGSEMAVKFVELHQRKKSNHSARQALVLLDLEKRMAADPQFPAVQMRMLVLCNSRIEKKKLYHAEKEKLMKLRAERRGVKTIYRRLMEKVRELEDDADERMEYLTTAHDAFCDSQVRLLCAQQNSTLSRLTFLCCLAGTVGWTGLPRD